MELQLYKSNSSFNTINKNLTLLDTLEIHLNENFIVFMVADSASSLGH